MSITSDLIKRASENDGTIQRVISHLANGILENGSEIGTEVEEVWQLLVVYRDRLSTLDGVLLCDGVAVIPTKLRQAVVDILGVAYRDARAMMDRAVNTAFWPNINEDILEHVKSRQVETQPYPRKRTVASRLNAPTRRPSENEHEWVNKKTREPHRDTGHARDRTKMTKRVPHKASRKDDSRWDREGAHYPRTTRDSRAMPRRKKKPLRSGVPAMQTDTSRFPYSQDSAWGARGYSSRSADSNGPDVGPADEGRRTRKIGPTGDQDGNHEM